MSDNKYQNFTHQTKDFLGDLCLITACVGSVNGKWTGSFLLYWSTQSALKICICKYVFRYNRKYINHTGVMKGIFNFVYFYLFIFLGGGAQLYQAIKMHFSMGPA